MRRGSALWMILLPAVLIAGCGSKPPKVVVGVGTDTHAYAAVKLAAKEINAAGGIGGVPLELVGLDESSASFRAESVVEMAARFSAVPHLVAVIGHGDSSATLTAAPIYNRQGIPHIVAIASNPAITNISPWTYRVCLSDAVQGPALAEYVVNRWGKKRLALFYVNDDYGRGLARLFEGRARALGAEVPVTATHRNTLGADDQDTIRDAVREMKQAQVDLAVLFQRVDAAAWTVKAIRDAGLDVPVLGGEDLAQAAFPHRTPVPTDGIRVSQFVNIDLADPKTARFDAALREGSGERAEASQALAYDAMYLLRDAMLNGGYTRRAIKDYLDEAIVAGRRFDGMAGSFTLGSDHDARRPLFIAELRGGRFQVLEPLEVR